jgi:hypothetical protein
MSLIVGVGPGNDSKVGEDKIKAYKLFANKMWNIATSGRPGPVLLDIPIDVQQELVPLSNSKTIELKIKRKKIIIDDIAVSGSADNRIILKTQFSGSKRGVIYLLATPVLNDSLKQIELTNVDFDVKTKSVLLKSAKWFFNSKINQLVEEQGKFNYTPMIEDMKKEINTSLNQPLTDGVAMSGRIASISLNKIYYTTTHLVLRTQIGGNLKLILE